MRKIMLALTGATVMALIAACGSEEAGQNEAAQVAEAPAEAVAPATDDTPGWIDREGFAVMIGDAGPAYIAGQPTEAALGELSAEGVTTVINLRTAAEMANANAVPFNEAETVDGLGMDYVLIEQGPDETINPAALDAFAAAMEGAEGKVLVHCGSGVRASHMWAAYLVREKGVSMEEALAEAEALNLKSEAPVRALLGLDADAPG